MRSTIAVVLAAAIGVVGCSDITEINDNPNAPTDVETTFIATAAMVETVDFAESTLNQDLFSTWSQHIAPIQYAWDDRYDVRSNTIEDEWAGVYTGPLQDWTDVIRTASDAGRADEAAVASVMRAWLFHMVTDAWGDVPYAQANTGDAEEGTTVPSYDSQQEIYQSLIADLSSAGSSLAGSGGLGTADFVYEGDLDAWRRFANSLRLRLAIRMSEVDAGSASQEFSDALTAGVIQSRAQEATFAWEATQAHQNPWCDRCPGAERPGGDKVSATMVDTLTSLSDPRLFVYARPNNEGDYVGLQNGLPDGHGIPFEARSRMGEIFVRVQDRPTILLGYDEVLFLRAEAAERGWTGEDAATLYEEAIRENMARYEIDQTQVDTYLAQPEVAYDPARGLEQIALQKWLAFFTRGIEAFAEVRRTGVPSLEPGPAAVSAFPRRLPYPGSETSLNSDELQEAISRQGGASITDPVWWDQQ